MTCITSPWLDLCSTPKNVVRASAPYNRFPRSRNPESDTIRDSDENIATVRVIQSVQRGRNKVKIFSVFYTHFYRRQSSAWAQLFPLTSADQHKNRELVDSVRLCRTTAFAPNQLVLSIQRPSLPFFKTCRPRRQSLRASLSKPHPPPLSQYIARPHSFTFKTSSARSPHPDKREITLAAEHTSCSFSRKSVLIVLRYLSASVSLSLASPSALFASA